MEIDIRSKTVVYINIGEHTYYIDDSTDEQIIEKWKKSDREKNIAYLLQDECLKELWNEDEFKQIPNLPNYQLEQLVNERKDFYNEQ